jgi:uncharacterized protein YqeY
MTLQQLQNEMITAMKSGDKFRKGVISVTIAQIKNAAIDKGCRDNIPESLVDETLLKAKKTCQEMLDSCPASRADLLEDYKKQMEIVCEFAPTLITNEAEIAQLVEDYADGAKISLHKENRGTIMKILSRNLRGKADMAIVSKVVGGMLQ